jgi:hypothetical protein
LEIPKFLYHFGSLFSSLSVYVSYKCAISYAILDRTAGVMAYSTYPEKTTVGSATTGSVISDFG